MKAGFTKGAFMILQLRHYFQAIQAVLSRGDDVTIPHLIRARSFPRECVVPNPKSFKLKQDGVPKFIQCTT